MSDFAFLEDIIANPDDDGRRLIYADWLEEHGNDPQTAALLRQWATPATTEKVKKLEQWQIDLMPLARRWWTGIGLRTGPTNRARAESAIRLTYQCAGLEEPEEIQWEKSPLAGAKNVRDSMWDSVRGSVRGSVRDSVCYGSHDAHWLAFYWFFASVCGVDLSDRLSGLWQCALHCGWFWAGRDVCVATELPVELEMIKEKMKRIVYSDGWAVEK